MKIKCMNESQQKDIKDKIHILKNIDRENKFHIEFSTIMLIKGFGYTSDKLKDGSVQKSFGENQDFLYYCEIGKLLDEYIPVKYDLDLLKTKVLDTKEILLIPQIYSCAENIFSKLSLAKKY